jgi:integrase
MSSLSVSWWPDDPGRRNSKPPARGQGGGATVQAVVAAYLNHLRARSAAGEYSADALLDVERELTRFAAWQGPRGLHGDQPVMECVPDDTTQWLLANPQWESNHTRKRVITTIIGCFSWAANEAGLIDRCPYRKLKSLRLPTKPRREARRDEYTTLMRQGSRPLRRALYFLRRTAARTCEMREAEFTDIAWEKSVIVLFKHKTERFTGNARRVLLDPGVIRFLRNLERQKLPGQRKIFVNNRGTVWTRHTFARHFRRIALRAGLDEGAVKRVSAYCVRHMVAGLLGQAGYSDRETATMLGHSSTRMVQVYNHNRENDQLLQRMAGELRKRRKGAPYLPGMEPP